MTINKKIIGGYSIVLLLMVILGRVFYLTLNKIEKTNKKVEDVLYLDMFLDEKAGDHLQWLNHLGDMFLTGEVFTGQLDSTKCDLGKWYANFKSDNKELMQIHADMDRPHKRLHDSAKKILDLYHEDKEGARSIYAREAKLAADEVLEKIEKMSDILMKDIDATKLGGYSVVNAAKAFVLISIFLAICCGIIVAILISNRITRPLRAVVKRIDEISGAEGDLRVEVPVLSNDEIGELAKSFNRMIAGLRNLIKQVFEMAQSVATSSEELSSSAQETNASTQQVAASILKISDGLAVQVNKTEETAKTMSEMAASVGQVDRNASTSSKSSEETVGLAQEGMEASHLAVEKINKITDSAKEIAQVVGKLGERSKEIDRIVEVITMIADQTNLLSLNAAIEAARAGEAGGGFAVVAAEVRKLAENSAQAAKQIRVLIFSIQEETGKAVSSVSEATQEVEAGRVTISKARQSLDGILSAAKSTLKHVEEIVEVAKVQIENSQKVNNNMMEVAAVSKNSAAAVNEVSSSTEGMQASMQQMSSSAQSLSSIAFKLQDLVNKFKIS